MSSSLLHTTSCFWEPAGGVRDVGQPCAQLMPCLKHHLRNAVVVSLTGCTKSRHVKFLIPCRTSWQMVFTEQRALYFGLRWKKVKATVSVSHLPPCVCVCAGYQLPKKGLFGPSWDISHNRPVLKSWLKGWNKGEDIEHSEEINCLFN